MADKVINFLEKTSNQAEAVSHNQPHKTATCGKEWRKQLQGKTPTQQHREEDFMKMLDYIFDVTYADAVQVIKSHEDKEFQTVQWAKGRKGSVGPSDRKLTNWALRRHKRNISEKLRKQKC